MSISIPERGAANCRDVSGANHVLRAIAENEDLVSAGAPPVEAEAIRMRLRIHIRSKTHGRKKILKPMRPQNFSS